MENLMNLFGSQSSTDNELNGGGDDDTTIIGGKKEKGVRKIIAKKVISDEDMATKYANTFVKPSMISTIINEDTDVYTEDGKLLLRFRKGVLDQKHIKDFYDNVIDFAASVVSSNRGNATGSKSKNLADNPKVMSNIFGYFDRFSPIHKVSFKKAGFTPLEVRPCRFNSEYPEKYKKAIPLIQDIDRLFKKYAPKEHAYQNKFAKQTHFKIPGTSFSTCTLNVNYQTAIHTDKGDLRSTPEHDTLGNLVVIENGKYLGGETCYIQYGISEDKPGIGVNVRTGDLLLMDVHKYHGNCVIKPIDKDAKRLSIVCYLREKLWMRTKNKSKKFYENSIKRFRQLTRKKKPTK